MKKILLSMSLIGAAFATGCGSSSGSSGGADVTNCTSDSECGGDVCNLVGHVCMHKCTTAGAASADCPSTEPTCAPVPGGTSLGCACTDTATCGGGSTICHPTDLLCEVQCSDTSACSSFNPARTCVGSACVAAVVDSGPISCVTTPSLCTATEMCDAATGACVPLNTCGAMMSCTAAANTQGSCPAQQYCTGTCCDAPAACAALSSSPSTSTGSPLIWGVVDTSQRADTSGTCAGDMMVHLFTVNYIQEGSGTLPTTSSGLYANIYVLTASGTLPAAGNSQEKTSITPDSTGTEGVFTFELCSDRMATAAAVVIKDTQGDVSNAACIPSF